MKLFMTALLLPLLPLAVQAAEPVWITVGADSGVELRQVKAKLAPLFRASAEGKARVAALPSLSVTVDVRVVRYRKNGDGAD